MKALNSMTADELLELLESPDQHKDIPDEALADFVYFSLSVYGTTNQSSLIPHLINLYREFVSRSDIETRRPLYEAIVDQVKEDDLSVNALMPFLGYEPEQSLVSTAVIDYCMCRVPDDGKPLSGIGDILGVLRSGLVSCPGGILAGLLLLGDRRVADLLPLFRQNLKNEDIAVFARTHSGILYSPMIEFYLDWLEELNGPQYEAEFGSLASGLVNMVQKDGMGVVVEVEREFGAVTSDNPIRPVRQVPFSDYFREVLVRMEALAATETDPKIMPEVIDRWRIHGLEL